jgi:hypothetical protein
MAISWIVFACVFGGAVVGMWLRRIMPGDYLSTDSQDVIKLVMGLIATMSALVLALLVSTATTSFDTQKNEVTQIAAGFTLLDRVLARYGPETGDTRVLLRTLLASGINQVWSENIYQVQKANKAEVDDLLDQIQHLEPNDAFHRSLHAQAMQITDDLGRTRALLLGHSGGSISMPFLVVLVFWLAMLFASFGLFAPPNAAVIGALLVGALSVAGAIFLTLNLDEPFSGLIQISSAPLRNALVMMGK